VSTLEQDQRLVEKHVGMLGEHFNNVQIMVSTPDGLGTRRVFSGAGDCYARQGLAHAFLKEDADAELAISIADALEP